EAFFQQQPALAKRRKQGRLDLSRIRSLSDKQAGYEVAHQKGRIQCIFVYLEPKDGHSAFQGDLGQGLRPTDSQADVDDRLGAPTRTGAADPEQEWLWDRYDTQQLCMHIAYGSHGKGIRMITLMAPDVAP